jgi:hypothetical protein
VDVNLLSKACVITIALLGVVHLCTDALASEHGYGFETVSLGAFTLKSSESQVLSLGFSHYIRNIVLSADSACTDGAVEVSVNGKPKKSVEAPGRVSSCVFAIGETASSIQFRLRHDGSLVIHDIVGTISTWAGRPLEMATFYGSMDQARLLAEQAAQSVEGLKGSIPPSDFNSYLLPIDQQAKRVLDCTEEHSDFSSKTIDAINSLEAQIDYATDYLAELNTDFDAFGWRLVLLNVRIQILKMMKADQNVMITYR